MKRNWIAIVLLLVMLTSLAVPAAAEETPVLGYVTDQPGLLTMEQWTELTQRSRNIEKAYGCAVYLVILEDYTSFGSTPRDAAKYIYKTYDLGCGEDKNGIMLMLSMADRDFWLLAYGDAANRALTDHGRKKMEETFLPYFGKDDWYGGADSYYTVAEQYLKLAAEDTPFDKNTDPDEKNNPLFSYGIGLLVGVAAALTVCFVFKSQMNTAVHQTTAGQYVPEDGITIRNRTDRYTHSTVQRVKIEKHDSSSGGTTVDRDGFSGSGGKF